MPDPLDPSSYAPGSAPAMPAQGYAFPTQNPVLNFFRDMNEGKLGVQQTIRDNPAVRGILSALMTASGGLAGRMPGAQPAVPPTMPGAPAFQNRLSNAPELGAVWNMFGRPGAQPAANANVPGAQAPTTPSVSQLPTGRRPADWGSGTAPWEAGARTPNPSADGGHVGRLAQLTSSQMAVFRRMRDAGKTAAEALAEAQRSR